MALRKPQHKPATDPISKSRAAKASVLTAASLAFLFAWLSHLYWAIFAIYNNYFGGLISNLMVGAGGVVLSGFISVQALLFLEKRFNDDIDADHKKYL